MTIEQRITRIDEYRRVHDNVIPFERTERRTTPRWLEIQQQRLAEYGRAGSDLTGYIGTGPDAA